MEGGGGGPEIHQESLLLLLPSQLLLLAVRRRRTSSPLRPSLLSVDSIPSLLVVERGGGGGGGGGGAPSFSPLPPLLCNIVVFVLRGRRGRKLFSPSSPSTFANPTKKGRRGKGRSQSSRSLLPSAAAAAASAAAAAFHSSFGEKKERREKEGGGNSPISTGGAEEEQNMERQESLLFPLGNRFSHFYQSLLRLPLANVGEGEGEGEGKAKQGIEGSHRTRVSGGGPIRRRRLFLRPSLAAAPPKKGRKEEVKGEEERDFFVSLVFLFLLVRSPTYLPTSLSLSAHLLCSRALTPPWCGDDVFVQPPPFFASEAKEREKGDSSFSRFSVSPRSTFVPIPTYVLAAMASLSGT